MKWESYDNTKSLTLHIYSGTGQLIDSITRKSEEEFHKEFGIVGNERSKFQECIYEARRYKGRYYLPNLVTKDGFKVILSNRQHM